MLTFETFFQKKSAMVLLKCLDIIKNAINLKPDKQFSYRLIYNLDPIKLKTLKTCIKSNLANGFI